MRNSSTTGWTPTDQATAKLVRHRTCALRIPFRSRSRTSRTPIDHLHAGTIRSGHRNPRSKGLRHARKRHDFRDTHSLY